MQWWTSRGKLAASQAPCLNLGKLLVLCAAALEYDYYYYYLYQL